MRRLWPPSEDAALADLYATGTRLTVDELLLDRVALGQFAAALNDVCGVTRAPDEVARRALTLRKNGVLARKVRS